jgi:hypothetical protein
MLARLFRVAVVVATVALSSARRAGACDCMKPPPTDVAFAKASVVVVAKVVKIEEDEQPPPNITPIDGGWKIGDYIPKGNQRIRLVVSRGWKGAKAGDTISITRPKGGFSDCDYDLPNESTHLLFLELMHERGLDSRAQHCGSSRPIAAANEGIAALDRIAPAPSPVPPSAQPSAPSPRGCGCRLASGDGGSLPVAIALGACAPFAARRTARRLRLRSTPHVEDRADACGGPVSKR